MKLVIIESPYAGDIKKNTRYARACLRDSLTRGEAPYASHLLYTQPGVLKDNIREERDLGISAGINWGLRADNIAVYIDLGITTGMLQGIRAYLDTGQTVEMRTLGGKWTKGVQPTGDSSEDHQQ